jgi:anti-sigma factor RsiW
MTKYIRCEELIAFLDDYVANALPPERLVEFERHLAVCASCVAYLASYRETIRLARVAADAPELRVEDVPAELVEAVVAALRR